MVDLAQTSTIVETASGRFDFKQQGLALDWVVNEGVAVPIEQLISTIPVERLVGARVPDGFYTLMLYHPSPLHRMENLHVPNDYGASSSEILADADTSPSIYYPGKDQLNAMMYRDIERFRQYPLFRGYGTSRADPTHTAERIAAGKLSERWRGFREFNYHIEDFQSSPQARLLRYAAAAKLLETPNLSVELKDLFLQYIRTGRCPVEGLAFVQYRRPEMGEIFNETVPVMVKSSAEIAELTKGEVTCVRTTLDGTGLTDVESVLQVLNTYPYFLEIVTRHTNNILEHYNPAFGDNSLMLSDLIMRQMMLTPGESILPTSDMIAVILAAIFNRKGSVFYDMPKLTEEDILTILQEAEMPSRDLAVTFLFPTEKLKELKHH